MHMERGNSRWVEKGTDYSEHVQGSASGGDKSQIPRSRVAGQEAIRNGRLVVLELRVICRAQSRWWAFKGFLGIAVMC